MKSRNRDTDIENKHVNSKWGEGGMNIRLGLTCVHYYI